MADDDVELKELVIKTLENNGVLSKLRAQLRANVFLALEETNASAGKKSTSTEFQSFIATDSGTLATLLVREYLQHFNFECTLSVFEQETHFGKLYKGEDHETITTKLGLYTNLNEKEPLIGKLVQTATQSTNTKKSSLETLRSTKESLTLPLAKKDLELVLGTDDLDYQFFDDPSQQSVSNKSLPQLKDVTLQSVLNLEKQKDSNSEKDNLKNFDAAHTSDDYEEDFQSSARFSFEPHSQSEEKTVSDHSVEEEIIEEVSSIGSKSQVDDVTTDHTVSQISTGGVDYMENVKL